MIKKILIAVAFVVTGLFVTAPTVSAVTVINCDTAGISASDCAPTKTDDLNYTKKASGVWKIVQFALGLLGGISVIMIIIGGFKYTTSNGDSSALTSAKTTILYSVVGLVVAFLASAIVLLIQGVFLK